MTPVPACRRSQPRYDLRAVLYTERPKGAAFGGNSGLGLSIVRQIIETHKGKVWAENIPGDAPGTIKGARFIVELPAAPVTLG